jgi:predicted transcriptional regulator
MIERGEMTETMKMSIVKILFKKEIKKRIENYRPITADKQTTRSSKNTPQRD